MFNKEKSVKIIFDQKKCTKCGTCTKACTAEYLVFKDGEITTNPNSFMGCIQCGRCMIKCPHNAIVVEGAGISGNSLIEFEAKPTNYDSLYSLLLKRRSARKFKDKEIPKEVIEKILAAASTGAISIPPYEVKILVINGKDNVREFKEDLLKSFEKMIKIFSPIGLQILRPFIGKNNYKLFKEFVVPLFKKTIRKHKESRDILFYDAPCIVIFYTTEICDKEDAIIAATLGSTAAETLGLGTCIIGSVPPCINNNTKIKEKYGIAKTENVATAFILGYPEITFDKGIKRDFKEVKWF